MILFRFTVITFVISNNFLKSKFLPVAKRGNEMLARLHTAISSGEQYSIISVQRLLLRIVPKCCWLLFLLAASLYNIYGVPVSICASNIAFQSSRAGKVLRAIP